MGEPISASSGPICGSRNIFQTTAATTPGMANGRMNPPAKARLRNLPDPAAIFERHARQQRGDKQPKHELDRDAARR